LHYLQKMDLIGLGITIQMEGLLSAISTHGTNIPM